MLEILVTGWRRTAVGLEGRHNYRIGNVGQVDQDLRLRSSPVLPRDQPDANIDGGERQKQ
jgi:hypothetical protein